jgi:hypothetical protein
MATRMQQRRGTAAQWTAANPVLAAGEIGFETDTSKFKMGNGSSAWTALTYFANAAELAAIIDGAPDLLNTLNELAASIGDDPAFLTTIATNLSNHATDTTVIHGIADTAQLATLSSVNEAISDSLGTHTADTTLVHGIADTSLLVTTADLNTSVGTTASDAAAALSAHNSDTTLVHGIADTSLLATTGDVETASSDAAAALLAHGLLTENVHGILNTADLATTSFVTDAVEGAAVDQSSLAGTGIDWNSVDIRFDIDSTVATKTYADDAVSTHNDDTTNVHGIADTSLLATTADVAAVTKTTLGLGNVDNTSDADKPVSTATVTAIATAKSEAIAEVTAVIDGAPNALNTLNELAAALGDDANFASTVTTSLATKVDSYTPITQKTASYTLSTLDHRDDLIEMGSASALTLTIPLNSSIAYPVGTSLDILQTGAGQVTIAGAAGVTVNATPGLKLRTQWSSATLFKRAENTWVVYGDLTA